MNPVRNAALAVTLASALAAQTFVVDAANGPGTNFTSIAAAVAAVPDGAVLLVRAGVYGGFGVQGKSLSVLGEPGVLIDFLIPQMTVRGLGPTQKVVLRELAWSNPLGPAWLGCDNNQGMVLIERCRADGTVSSSGGGVLASQCAQLQVRDSVFDALTGPALTLQGSATSVLGCDLSSSGWLSTGIDLLGGTLQVASSRVAGGFAARAAVSMSAATLVVRGGSTLVGDAQGSGLVVDGTGTLRIDPNTTLVPPGAGFGGLVLLSALPMPFVDATTQPLGGVASATLQGPLASLGMLLAGFPAIPQIIPPFADELWLDPGSAVIAASGGMRVSAAYVVPPVPQLRGAVVGWQGVTLEAAIGRLQLGNPAFYVHR